MSKPSLSAASPVPKAKKAFKICFIAFVLIWVGWGVPGAVKDLSLGYQSENWPKVSAVITRVEWIDYVHSGSTAPRLSYRYEVNGRTFTSDRFAFADDQQYDRGDVRAFIDNDVLGATVTARYNPADPSVAVLLTGGQTSPAVMILVAIAFSIAAVWVWRS